MSDYQFIWAIRSDDCLMSRDEATEDTMNDLEITYYPEDKQYGISIETIYSFRDGFEGELKYLQSLLDKFTTWMLEQKYDTEQTTPFCRVFSEGGWEYHIGGRFNTIEELYSYFKILVLAYSHQGLREKSLAICKSAAMGELTFWKTVNALRAIGCKMPMAKRMANRAVYDKIFMWEGHKIPIV